MADNNYIIDRVKKSVHAIDPEAEIILYGSRARGTASEESDWDFLILTAISLDHKTKKRISRVLYEIEWETCEIISPLIHEKGYWQSPLNKVTPFYKNVTSQGISL